MLYSNETRNQNSVPMLKTAENTRVPLQRPFEVFLVFPKEHETATPMWLMDLNLKKRIFHC